MDENSTRIYNGVVSASYGVLTYLAMIQFNMLAQIKLVSMLPAEQFTTVTDIITIIITLISITVGVVAFVLLNKSSSSKNKFKLHNKK